jgi:gas vesicle protein
MKAATVSDIKEELTQLPKEQLTALCLRLARFKKENKELLTFLLFEAHDIPGYITSVKQEMDEHFASINTASVYFVKKSLRKILRITNKYIRYSGNSIAEAELLIYFCRRVSGMDAAVKKNTVIANIYQSQLKKIKTAIADMHEDLQYDYLKEAAALEK